MKKTHTKGTKVAKDKARKKTSNVQRPTPNAQRRIENAFPFEIQGAILCIHQEFHHHRGGQWIDLEAWEENAQRSRTITGLPIPAAALMFVRPGCRLKLAITVFAEGSAP